MHRRFLLFYRGRTLLLFHDPTDASSDCYDQVHVHVDLCLQYLSVHSARLETIQPIGETRILKKVVLKMTDLLYQDVPGL